MAFWARSKRGLLYYTDMDMQVTSIAFFIVALLVAMSFHEAMHAFVAHWLGDTTAKEEGRLTLNPLKHIDLVTTIVLPVVLVALSLPPILAAKPVPFNPNRVRFDEFGAALVGLAGPFSNLLLAAVTAGIIHVSGVSIESLWGGFLLTFVEVNIALFVFNMLPLPPLDGSRLLYAVAPEPVQKVMYRMESMGIFGVLIILFLLLPIIGPFLNAANTAILRLLLG